MPLTEDKNKRFDKKNANIDTINDYFNRILSRQRTKDQNDRNIESLNKNKKQNDRNIDSVSRNKNQTQSFNDYFSRYVIQMNKSNSFDTSKNQDRNDINFNRNTDTFTASTNLNDRFSETKTTNDKHPNDINSLEDVNASDALLDISLLRVMLPIKVTQQMCPDSHLIAYFYHNGEFVSASKHFDMDDCFINKVNDKDAKLLKYIISTIMLSFVYFLSSKVYNIEYVLLYSIHLLQKKQKIFLYSNLLL